MPISRTDVLVIGAGQAGLAAAYWLRKLGVTFAVVDASIRTGDSWRTRYRSLTLFTPRSFSSLPGLPLDGDPDGYASGTEFGNYLERYAEKFGLSVRHGTRVETLSLLTDGSYRAKLAGDGEIAARVVVIAAGGFQRSIIPEMAAGFGRDVAQCTASTYRSPADIASGRVLVVGDGASGRDIAADLARTHAVLLACGRPRRLLPERIFGIGTWTWLRTLGLLGADTNSPVGRLMRRADPFPNRERDLDTLRRKSIDVRPRAIGAEGAVARFADGSSATVGTVIWALGYCDDTAWIDIPAAKDNAGVILEQRGQSTVPGLYFIGRPWQRNRASALIMGAGPDAKLIAGQVKTFLGVASS
jgi:putative flavoprotein involved in K+ transport